MKFFEKYTSNTCAGSGNQHFFKMEKDEIRTGRVFYKIFAGGEYNYSVLFSNIIDSTFADGSVSHKNLVCDSWKIISAKIGKCKQITDEKEFCDLTVADEENKNADIIVSDFQQITFGGSITKDVMPGEFFSCDPVKCSFKAGEYLCLEITFSGTMIPYHEESMLPVFIKTENGWEYSRYMPFAGMIGCDRKTDAKIAFFGDSITQGIGPKPNSYKHWNALLADRLGDKYAYWNIGLGFGRANDGASDGAWLFKARQNDVIAVCFGVNDLNRGFSENQIKSDLTYIVETLKNEGKKVVLQTIPPFDYKPEIAEIWQNVNMYIKTKLALKADIVFDVVPVLAKDGKEPHKTKFGGHPNEEGSALWADALYEKMKVFLEDMYK